MTTTLAVPYNEGIEPHHSQANNIKIPAEADSPAAGRLAVAGSPVEVGGSPVEAEGSPVEEAGSPVEEAGSPVEEAGSQAGMPLAEVCKPVGLPYFHP